jgi:hypothetical protein
MIFVKTKRIENGKCEWITVFCGGFSMIGY